MKISASLLSCDLLNIESEIKILTEAGIDSLHIDVMDGHFVPNLAFGIDIIKQIKRISKVPINVHMMIENPELFLDKIIGYDVNAISLHAENEHKLYDNFRKIKNSGIKTSLAINPETNISDITKYIEVADQALIMGVHPGFGGQSLILPTLQKIEEVKKFNATIEVAIDGGINDKTFKLAREAKADIVIIGSYLFEKSSRDRLTCVKEKILAL
ncbi:MAG: ribulose-phosphate 3-epimerase [Alphaproteobacteria bacterium]|nr:ribulose-phosphate 3-epimerase [Alphaproteobacteria bacterium]